jgi:threonine synthase
MPISKVEVFCSVCGRPREDELSFRCSCGGPFDISRNFPFAMPTTDSNTLKRYVLNFPYINKDKIVSLGEQVTPLVRFRNNALFKLDYILPTFSFKDRGSTALISSLLSSPAPPREVREDSSGNAGASIAAYCARAGIRCRIFVPVTVSGPKAQQIEAYGADVVKIRGTRIRVAEEAMKDKIASVYVGHAWHPYFRDGIRTLAYEICEQLNWDSPDFVFLPVSAGTLLLGLLSGLKHMLASDVISRMPKVVCAQTEAVSPLHHRLNGKKYNPPATLNSVADALVSVNPPLLELMTKECKDAKVSSESISEEEIVNSWRELSRSGFFVEPSSAVAFAAYRRYHERGVLDDKTSVVVLTGAGLKRTGTIA